MKPSVIGKQILKYHAMELSQAEIAKLCGCTKANVSQTIARYKGWSGYVAPLPQAEIDWLLREATKNNVPAYIMARAILIDAINEARETENGKG